MLAPSLRLSLLLVAPLAASLVQDPKPASADAPAAIPAPAPADVATPGAVVDALYATISGPAGQPRDWQRLRSLFAPEGRMVAMVKARAGGMRALHLTVDDYLKRAGVALERDGFFEQEIARTTQQFGDLAHVFSTYEGRRRADDAEPFLRGINSIQLIRTGDRWGVLQILWQQESDAGPIPARFLVSGDDAKAPPADAPPAPKLAVRLRGSDLLLELMQQWQARCPETRQLELEVAGGGTGSSFRDFAVGKADVLLAARRIRDVELAKARESGNEPLELCFGYRAAAICVHPDNPIASLDLEQLRAIAAGETTAAKWSQLGTTLRAGADDEIVLRQSFAGSMWSLAFRTAVFQGQVPPPGVVIESRSLLPFVCEHENAIVVAPADPDAIAAAGAKVVPIAGARGGAVLPTAETIRDGSYPLTAPIYVYYRDEPSGRVKRFVRWLASDDGTAMLSEHGIVPAR